MYNSKIIDKNKYNCNLSILFPIFIGIITFGIIYGFRVLNPQNDAWIMAGYDESDIIQHYSGWLAFRNSKWSFPLGLANDMAVGQGTIISYTDSILWVAIFFKLFRSILPETFQYFGIYTFLCYILQSIAAYKILLFKTKDIKYSLLGTLFFSFAPILLERAFRHTALGSQWLILFSILLYFKHKEQEHSHITKAWQYKVCLILSFLIQMLVTYLCGCVIGVLGNGINISRDGFGYFNMNINAIINPTSAGGYTWSTIMRVRPQILGNYDGFNYLGVGIGVLIICSVVLIIIFGNRKDILKQIKNISIVLVVIMTLFAISNVVTYDDKILFTCPLPEFILKICGIFRASSRMFYLVYYLLILFFLILINSYNNKINIKKLRLLVLLSLIVQFIDIHSVITQKYQKMSENQNYISILQDNSLKEITKNAQFLILDNCSTDTRKLAVWAHKNNMKTFFSVANSGDYSKCEQLKNKMLQEIIEYNDLNKYIIATTDEATTLKYNCLSSVCIYQCEGIYYIYKKR